MIPTAHDVVTLVMSPDDVAGRSKDVRRTRTALYDLIDRAVREILVFGFSFDDPAVLDRLDGARRRGVEVALHLDADQMASTARAAALLGAMEQRGFTPALHRTGERSSLHAKAIVVDGSRALIGSANLTERGADRNLELGVIIEGPSVATLRDALLGWLRDHGE